MIQADQQQKAQQQREQQQKRGRAQPSQQGQPAAPAAAAKKRRLEQQPSRQVMAPAAPGVASCVGSAAAQQAAAMQQLLLQTVLQPLSPPAARVSSMLPQQAPTPLQLLQAVSAAAGLTGALAPPRQMPSIHPPGVPAVADKPQMLQALCSAAPQAVLAAQAMAAAGRLDQGGCVAAGRGSVPGFARPSGAGQGPWGPAATGVLGLMQGIAASGAAGYAPAAPAAAAQLQALLGGWPGMGQLTGLVRGM
jgi:hypothetical protein